MTEDELLAAWEGINERATKDGLTIFPAAPERVDVIWQDEDWDAFITVAEACGTRLLYVDAVTGEEVVPEELEEPDDPSSDLTAALAAAKRLGDKVCRIELAFSYGGLVHQWAEELPWLAHIDEFGARSRAFASDADEFGEDGIGDLGDWMAQRQDLEEQQRAEFDKLLPEIERLTSEIGAAPEYLSGRSRSERHAIALSLAPTLQEWRTVSVLDVRDPVAQARRRAVREILGASEEHREREMAKRVSEARANLDNLVVRLRQDSEYSEAPNANIRGRRAKALVTQWLGFPSTEIRDLLVARDRQKGT